MAIQRINGDELIEGRIYEMPSGVLVAAHHPNLVAGSVPVIDLVDEYLWVHPSRYSRPLTISHNAVIRDGDRAIKSSGQFITLADLVDTGLNATAEWGRRRTR